MLDGLAAVLLAAAARCTLKEKGAVVYVSRQAWDLADSGRADPAGVCTLALLLEAAGVLEAVLLFDDESTASPGIRSGGMRQRGSAPAGSEMVTRRMLGRSKDARKAAVCRDGPRLWRPS